MPIDFYYMEVSAPCRAVRLTAKAVGLEMNMKNISLATGDHMKPEFLAINPQHCVPTVVDGDIKLWESRAICSYFASQYGKDDSLYPNDPKKRAQVDRLLYFDMGTLFNRFFAYVSPVFFGGAKKPSEEAVPKIKEALGWLDDILKGHDYAVGNHITVADHCLVATTTTIAAVGVDISSYRNVAAWVERCSKNMPGYKEANENGVKAFQEFAKSKLS